jgi:2-aminoadipate transaminase
MGNIFSDRISDVPRSFIREILKFTIDESVISFAGGLPSRDLFPLKEIKAATQKVLETAGKDALQYSTSEGYGELREWIVNRYKSKNITIHSDNVLITTGSQQGLDLLGKTFLNEGDNVVIEEPGYLGAIQAFSIYRSTFFPAPVTPEGMVIDLLEQATTHHLIKLMYCVPNFQNPSGISYSEPNRKEIARILKDKKTILMESYGF